MPFEPDPVSRFTPDEEAKPAKKESTFLDKLKGYGEAALTLGTGATGGLIGRAGGTIGGLAGTIGSGEIGTQEGVRRASEVAGEAQNRFTYQPRSEEGKATLATIGELFDKSKLAGMGPTESITLAGLAPPRFPRVAGKPTEAQEAVKLGLKITPTQAGAGFMNRMAEGLAGSAKMEKLFSTENAKVFNNLLKADLGLPLAEDISAEALSAVRKQAGGAYEAVKRSGVTLIPNREFRQAISSLGGDFKAASRELPGLIGNPEIDNITKSLSVKAMSPNAAIEATKYLRSAAARNLKAGFIDPEKAALGMAQKRAANALDGLIESNLAQAGKPDLAQAYQTARVTIAKAHDIEAALNETTGDVSARHLARIIDKGGKLSGNTEKVAKFAQAYEGSARDLAKMRDPSEFSYGDLLLGGLGGAMSHAATGNIAGLSAVAARPAVRHLMMTGPYQRAMASQVPLSGILSRPVQASMIPLSQLAPYERSQE